VNGVDGLGRDAAEARLDLAGHVQEPRLVVLDRAAGFTDGVIDWAGHG
jgi:hypothetical protein